MTRSVDGARATTMSVVVAFAILVSACSSGDSEIVAGVDDLGHIHDLTIGNDGRLLVASHTGLYRIEATDRAVLIGSEQHDLMAMTADEDGTLIASGHPDLRLEEYRVQDRPPFLGLARSSDGGRSWETIDLLGGADFHALAPHRDGLFAAETSGRIWFLNPEREWLQLGEVDARDLAIDGRDSDRQLAPDYEGSVWVSSDGAATWSRVPDAPALVEIEWVGHTIFGIDQAGTVWATEQPQGPWIEFAAGPTEVETFYVDPSGAWWVTVPGGAISRSDDNGSTWVDVYVPPSDS